FDLKKVALGALGVLIVSCGSLIFLRQPIQIATGGLRDAIAALERQSPPAGTRVGSWNAGLVAFLAPEGVHVINLDGLVNDADFARNVLGGELWTYLKEKNVTYLLDYSNSLESDNWLKAMYYRLGE